MKVDLTQFPVWFCDIWGVVHNGYEPFSRTVETLIQNRKAGGSVILVSNSPRSAKGVERQLAQIGVDPASHDAIVTSGDVTQDLMSQVPGGKLFHLGPERDLSLYDGLAVERVPLEAASTIVCTGIINEFEETPDDYLPVLKQAHARNLPMICANPDKVVRKGSRIIYCAGSLAEIYTAMGGTVQMAGKPYAPIYNLARRHAERLRGAPVASAQILAIGDGPETDILGAAEQGIACIYVSGGVRDQADDLDAELAHIRALVPAANVLCAVHDLTLPTRS